MAFWELNLEHPTYIHAGSDVQAKRVPLGASWRSQVLPLLRPASGLVHLYIS
jgi:hypothetical protein